MTIAIDGSPSSLRARARNDGVVQKEAIVYYSHVGRFLAVATDRIDVSVTYTATHTRAFNIPPVAGIIYARVFN